MQLPIFRSLALRGKSDNRLRANCLYPVMAALRGGRVSDDERAEIQRFLEESRED